MNEFVFLNSLTKKEKKRFINSFNMITKLFTLDYRNKLVQKANNKIIKINIGFDKGIKGHVENYNNDLTKSIIKYEPFSIFHKAKSYHISTHEIIHALGKGNLTNEEIIKNNVNKIVLSNVFIGKFENGHWNNYGRIMSEVGVELLTSLALSFDKSINNKERIIADDIIKNDLEFWESGYKLFAPIARLMTYAMNNDFTNTYYGIIKNDLGLIDKMITIVDEDNISYEIPTNDYLYSLMIDGLHVEKVFNYYSNECEAWKKMCIEIDNEFSRAVNSKDKILDQYVIKKQILKIYNMFKNKLYIYKLNNIIDEELEQKMISEFEEIFNDTLKKYGLKYDKYDEKLINEAIDITNTKLNRENIRLKPYKKTEIN